MSAREENKPVRESCPPSPVSTRSSDLISRVDIAEITDIDDHQALSTSAVLSRCKHKILKPYLCLLAVMGLRSFGTERPNVSKVLVGFGYFHLFQAIVFTVVGYVVQFMACFRRDRGFCRTRDSAFGFALPCALHFAAYGYALYLLRFKETEKLQNLMERTFLLSARRGEGPRKVHLLRSLWMFVCFAVLWLALSLAAVVLQLLQVDNIFPFFSSENYEITFKVILVLSTLWQDMVQAVVISTYCLQAQLLICSLCFLRAKLLQHTIQPLSWTREINECQNFLTHLNDDFSPSVCLLVFLDTSWAISGVVCMVRCGTHDKITAMANIFVACLWLVAAIAPFVMAAWLTSACSALRHLGHEVRIRPFVYQDTPGQELDTILLYTSTLRLRAKLFGVPIEEKYLFACVTLIGVTVMVVGMNRLI